ncbi:MAG TPA: tetratricopeptide repeat protein [Stellaceae bacterium]|nr:tetratricopeptide repeat protein [Stellaceae bacterium]
MSGIARATAAGAIGICSLVISIAAPCRSEADEATTALLTRELAAAEAHEGRASPQLLPVIEKLALARLRDGALDDAAALRRRALKIALAASGNDSPSAAQAMAALALTDIDRRRYLDAEPLLIIAARVLGAQGAADQPRVAAIYAGLARIALARGDTRPAEAWASRSVEIARRNPGGRSAEPLRALGAVLIAAGRFTEAARVLDEALAEDRKQHGADGEDTARSLSQLANLDLRDGKPGDALALIEEATAIDQQRLGAAHPFIADDLHDLGLAYEALKRIDAARDAFIAAIQVLERGAGKETPRVAYAELELSRLYRQQGNERAADAAFADARRILNKAEAEEHRRERHA